MHASDQTKPTESLDVSALLRSLDTCMLADRHPIRQRVRNLQRAPDTRRTVEQIAVAIQRSQRRFQTRRAKLPSPSFPDELPVSSARQQIAETIAKHQVVIVAGETGSGKTTQLPKICLSLGRGVGGMIGHTQPRRIAARSVAARIADELSSPLGQLVGYKIRFADKLSDDTFVKVMTDGILLAETQHDRYLTQYDTIIIDEAHERSLNIDFLLGYLKHLLPKRPELKLIITSATINPELFSRHFDDAPMLNVSGRVYPVQTRYRPPIVSDDEIEMSDEILRTIDELWSDGPGDTLVFLPGEREIREAAEALRKHHPPHTEILPLYAQLSGDEQQRVFAPHGRPRIILATNVAETSLTVPGIRYVVDTGVARISRYSPRSKVQRLPIEPISQASADQRQGRCGRVMSGVCVRLYAQQDFESRPKYTDPEILRTNLAAVILQMTALRLGEVQSFPFVQPPDYKLIKDGYQTLHEIGAIDEQNRLTDLGRSLARLPIDPRIGRMVLAAIDEDCVEDVLIIAAALSVQDPRQRPMENPTAADAAHAQFRHPASDFLSFLNLWRWYHEQARHLSHSKLRKLCKETFLSYARMREWHDVHQQIRSLVMEMQPHSLPPPGERAGVRGESSAKQGLFRRRTSHPSPQPSPLKGRGSRNADAIHRALLSGLLSNIGQKTDTYEYTGARGMKFNLFPGSALFDVRPPWVVAAELVETTRLYARTVAAIQPEWAEQLADHLVKRTHSDPHWNRPTGHVVAYEKVTLYGLPLIARRSVHYGPIDPLLSREIFIRDALVMGDYDSSAPFMRHNQQLLEQIQSLEAKSRQGGIVATEQARFDFYDRKIPAHIHNGPAFEKWRRDIERHSPKFLFMTRRDLMAAAADHVTQDLFPDAIVVAGVNVPLEYHFEPGHPADGVTAALPLAAMNHLPAPRFEWLVPGLLREKITALIKSLPKNLRVNFVPAPEFAEAAHATLKPDDDRTSLSVALATYLSKTSGVRIPPDALDPLALMDHLHMNFKVIDEGGKVVAGGRDLDAIRRQLGVKLKESLEQLPPSPFVRDDIRSWDFGDLPAVVEVRRAGMTLPAYPALMDRGQSVSLRLFDTPRAAHSAHEAGVRRLFSIQIRPDLKIITRALRDSEQMFLNYSTLGSAEHLKGQIEWATASLALSRAAGDHELPRTQQAFADYAAAAYQQLNSAAGEIIQLTSAAMSEYQNALSAVSRAYPPLLEPSVQDVKAHLSRLMDKDFLSSTPPPWLAHLPRYLKAVQMRLSKLLNAGLSRDQQNMEVLRPLEERYLTRREQVQSEAMQTYRWLLEEFRVSLFAQELKTAVPVSVKRLEQQWQAIG